MHNAITFPDVALSHEAAALDVPSMHISEEMRIIPHHASSSALPAGRRRELWMSSHKTRLEANDHNHSHSSCHRPFAPIAKSYNIAHNTFCPVSLSNNRSFHAPIRR